MPGSHIGFYAVDQLLIRRAEIAPKELSAAYPLVPAAEGLG